MSFPKLAVSLLILITTFSCEDKEKMERDEFYAKNKNARENLISKYNAVLLNNDNILGDYLFKYQEKFIGKNKLVALRGDIFDIFKTDSGTTMQIIPYLKLDGSWIAQITFDLRDLKIKSPNWESKSYNTVSGCFIIKVSKIGSRGPAYEYVPEHNENEAYLELKMFENRILIFKGELVDMYIDE